MAEDYDDPFEEQSGILMIMTMGKGRKGTYEEELGTSIPATVLNALWYPVAIVELGLSAAWTALIEVGKIHNDVGRETSEELTAMQIEEEDASTSKALANMKSEKDEENRLKKKRKRVAAESEAKEKRMEDANVGLEEMVKQMIAAQLEQAGRVQASIITKECNKVMVRCKEEMLISSQQRESDISVLHHQVADLDKRVDILETHSGGEEPREDGGSAVEHDTMPHELTTST